MELKPGYKQTEVGVIPEDWEVAPLDTFITDFHGGAPLKPSDFMQTGVKVIPKGGVGRTGWLEVNVDDWQYCSPKYAESHQTNQVDQTYTIVVLRDLVPSGPSIGLTVEVKTPDAYILAQGVYGFKLTSALVPRYLVYLSNTGWYRTVMNTIMVGSTQVHISTKEYKRTLIPLPPLPEQKAIAKALSDMDSLLSGLDSLIAKKRDIKQATMQQLLAGKTRLPGFSGEWEVKRLGDVFSITTGLSKSSYVEADGDFVVCDMGSVSTDGQLIASKKTNRGVDFLMRGDLVMPKDDIGGGNIIGRVGYINSDKKYVLGDHVYCLRTAVGDPKYLAYAINSKQVNSDLRRKVTGSAQLGLGRKSVVEQPVPFPPLPEQQAIAKVLTDMDAELEALEQRRDKTRELKQAMMQELLTGRTRLV